MIDLTRDGDTVRLRVAPSDVNGAGAADIHVVRYVPEAVVSIEAGENAGQRIAYSNIVTDWLTVGRWDGVTPAELTFEAPGSEPVGARISAGKSGKVARSFPKTAAVLVNCVPVSCMPSPESPAKRIVTRSRSSTVCSGLVCDSVVMEPLLSTLWSLHHLVRARRQVEDVFRVRFCEVLQEIPKPDETDHRFALYHGQCPVLVLLHRRDCLGHRPRGLNRARLFGEHRCLERLVPVKTVLHAFRQHIALCEDAGNPATVDREDA